MNNCAYHVHRFPPSVICLTVWMRLLVCILSIYDGLLDCYGYFRVMFFSLFACFLPCVYDEMHIRHDARRETAGTRQEPMVPVPGDEPLLTGFFLDRVDIR